MKLNQEEERKAYVCIQKGEMCKRVFLLPGDAEPSRCEQHGVMQRQANLPYETPKKKRKGRP